jgi:hypothetical protein
MKSNIFIPKKINVGFQNREDTYTKKLAYVIYYDQKGILRKEASWNSWRDDEIEPKEFENIPTSGFVLNKKAGGYDTGWNHRQTYVRVYDPRDFEFEISIPNLLFILENTNSIKGKGLEGNFVYGWDGTELVLMPVAAPDYIEIEKFNNILSKNECIKPKDLIIGATYKTKNNDEYIYIGKFDTYNWGGISEGKQFIFAVKGKDKILFYTKKSINDFLISVIDEKCVSDYAEIFDKLECENFYSPIDESKNVIVPYEIDEFKEKLNEHYWCSEYYDEDKEIYKLRKCEDKEGYEQIIYDSPYWGKIKQIY